MYRVVIADDDRQTCKIVRGFLQKNGYQIAGEVEDGLEAVMVCRRERPDFIIMDLSMPVMTGLEAIRVIRREKLVGFIIVLTSCRNKALLHQVAQEDIMGYLVKPVEESSLLGAVEVALCQEDHILKAERECRKTKKALADRKYIEKAKGLLMEYKKLSENEAYSYIRRQAMDKEQTMAEIARILLRAYEIQPDKTQK